MRRKPPRDLVGVEPLDRQVVQLGGAQRALDDVRIGLADHEAAGLEEQRLAARPLELAPQVARSTRDRREARMLEAGDPEQARCAGGTAPRMHGLELLEPEHVQAAGSEPPGGARADRAEADHRDVRVVAVAGLYVVHHSILVARRVFVV